MEDILEIVSVSDKDEIEVSIGTEGAAVKAKGEAATRIGHAFADALRFFTSPLGLAAEEVDRFRIYRQVAFEQTLQKAYNVAVNRKIHTSNVPLKFLAQWGESASLEDMGDPENLSDLWANLLVSESSGHDPNSLIYIDILKKLNKQHIQYLSSLLDGPYPSAVGNPSITFSKNTIESMLFEPFSSEIEEVNSISSLPESEIKKKIAEINQLPGVELLAVSSRINRELLIIEEESFWFEWIREGDDDCEGDQPDLIFSSLAALELVDRDSGRIPVFRGLELEYFASMLTPLGWDFLRACSDGLDE